LKNTANIFASLYDGQFDVGFDCVGVETCRFALCSEMPPDGSEECFYRDHGSCRLSAAQYAALELLLKRIKGKMKELDEE
jgi:hypothetical protein